MDKREWTIPSRLFWVVFVNEVLFSWSAEASEPPDFVLSAWLVLESVCLYSCAVESAGVCSGACMFALWARHTKWLPMFSVWQDVWPKRRSGLLSLRSATDRDGGRRRVSMLQCVCLSFAASRAVRLHRSAPDPKLQMFEWSSLMQSCMKRVSQHNSTISTCAHKRNHRIKFSVSRMFEFLIVGVCLMNSGGWMCLTAAVTHVKSYITERERESGS